MRCLAHSIWSSQLMMSGGFQHAREDGQGLQPSALGDLPLPTAAVLPDYGDEGLYGFAAGLRTWLHDLRAGWRHGGVESGASSTVVVIVIDGLGDGFLNTVGAGSTLLAYRRGSMSSVFPSTTASALTTLLTGVAPAVHGLNGWFIHDRRFGGVIAPLPLLHRGGPEISAFRLLPRLCPVAPMWHHACRPVNLVSPAEIAYSRFSLHHGRGAHIEPYDGIEDFGQRIIDMVDALASSGGLVHAYYPGFDALSHLHGCRSAHVQACFWRLDALFASLLDRLSGRGVHLVVTADHGFIDAPAAGRVDIAPGSESAAMLAAPLFGERRLAFCKVREGAGDEFEAWAGTALAGKAVAIRAHDCLAAGLLGPGEAHSRLLERVGTHVLLMEPGCTIVDQVEGETPYALIGVHGGLTVDEMRVPRIVTCT